LRDPISKVPNTKKAGGVSQSVGPEFKPQYCKNKTKNQKPKTKKKERKEILVG
jgi:hypothetical protein